VFDIVKELKGRKAKRVFVATAFALFTEGIEKFNEYYEKGLLDRVYSTNLTYVPSQAKNAEWFREVDMAEYISTLIDFVNKDKSISQLVDGRWGIKELLKK
jgi:ribose-phosphate pyrophosphokinase